MLDALKGLLINRATQLLARLVAGLLLAVAGYSAAQADTVGATVAAAAVAVALGGFDLLVHRTTFGQKLGAATERWIQATGFSLVLLAGVLMLPGCQDPLIAANDSTTAAYRLIANARDAGILKQAEIDKYKPVRQAIDDALDEAGRQRRAGNTGGVDAALAIVERSLVDLAPLLNKAKAAKPSAAPGP